MNTYYHLIMIFLVFSLFTVNTKASTWKKEFKNQTIDETLRFNDRIFILSHQNKNLHSLNLNNSINSINSHQTQYFITELDKDGNMENAVSFQSSIAMKKAVLSSTGDLFVLMQDQTLGKKLNKISLKHFDLSLNLVQKKDFVLKKVVDFGKLIQEDNHLYLMGIESDTEWVRLVKLTNELDIEWMKQLNGYPADVQFLNESAYDIKVYQQDIYVTFNSLKTIQLIGSPPVNPYYSGVVAHLNSDGDLQWARKIQYVSANYFGSQVLNIAHVNQNGLWIMGNVSPLCFEGCPKSVVYKMSLSGDVLSQRTLSPGFYNYINDGTSLANGDLIFYGFSNDDVLRLLQRFQEVIFLCWMKI